MKNHLSASRGRLELHAQRRIVLLLHLYPLQFVQLFDTGLDLIRFGGFITEPLDKLLTLLDESLLVFISGTLLLHPLLAELHVFGIGDLIVVNLPEHHLYGTGSDTVQKPSVV